MFMEEKLLNIFKIATLEYIQQKLTSDKFTLQMVRGDTIGFENDIPTKHNAKNPSFSPAEEEEILVILEEMLHKQIIRETTYESTDFMYPIFIVKKPAGGARLILNLKELNEFGKYEYFKMHGINTIVNMVTRNCFMATIDFKDACYSVAISRLFQKFLKFRWKEKLYCFTCFPNGLGSCPRKFTKSNKVPVTTLHFENVQSQIVPTQNIRILGFVIDSVKMIITLTEVKKQNLKTLVLNLLRIKKPTMRYLAKVIGTIISCIPTAILGPLFYRYLKNGKVTSLRLNKGNFDAPAKVSSDGKQELEWWLENTDYIEKTIALPSIDLEYFCDLSSYSWGAHFDAHKIGGAWNMKEKAQNMSKYFQIAR